MPASEQSNGGAPLSEAEQGVLSNLPRTRPQRATRGRIAAREAGAAAAAEAPAPTRAGAAPPGERDPGRASRARAGAAGRGAGGAAGRGPRPVRPQGATKRAARAAGAGAGTGAGEPTATSKQPRAKRTPRRPGASAAPAPRQGFETEGERVSGPVQPPGGAELVASAAEIVGELTRAGFSAGERLLKDVFSRLPGS